MNVKYAKLAKFGFSIGFIENHFFRLIHNKNKTRTAIKITRRTMYSGLSDNLLASSPCPGSTWVGTWLYKMAGQERSIKKLIFLSMH